MGTKNQINDSTLISYNNVLPDSIITTIHHHKTIELLSKNRIINPHTLLRVEQKVRSFTIVEDTKKIQRATILNNKYTLEDIKNFAIHNEMSTVIVTKKEFFNLFRQTKKNKYKYAHCISSFFGKYKSNSSFSVTIYRSNLFFYEYKKNDAIVLSFRVVFKNKVTAYSCFLLSNTLDGILTVDSIKLAQYSKVNFGHHLQLFRRNIVPVMTKINKPIKKNSDLKSLFRTDSIKDTVKTSVLFDEAKLKMPSATIWQYAEIKKNNNDDGVPGDRITNIEIIDKIGKVQTKNHYGITEAIRERLSKKVNTKQRTVDEIYGRIPSEYEVQEIKASSISAKMPKYGSKFITVPVPKYKKAAAKSKIDLNF